MSQEKLKIAGLALALSALLAGCGDSSSQTPAQQLAEQLKFSQGEDPAFLDPAGRYIVRLDDGALVSQPVDVVATDLVASYGGTADQIYRTAFRGFVLVGDENSAQSVAADPRVLYVEADQKVSLSVTQNGATWGLDRSDQTTLPLNATYEYTASGRGVHVYIVDTGINTDHQDFAGRVGQDYNAVPDAGRVFGGNIDCEGHGTHVAGTAVGTRFGMAKDAIVHAVRTFSCAPTTLTSFIIDGVDWVAANHESPAVANLSLGGGGQSMDDAVRGMIESGVVAVVAAGNDTIDACGVAPARVPEAITVASSTRADARSSFSNFGECVDLFAPGSSITSADNLTSSGQTNKSGTSMAAPHVAGAVAKILERSPGASFVQVTTQLLGIATPGVVSDPRGSPNLLLYSR